MAVTLRSGIIIGLIGLALIGIGYNAISSSDQDTIVGLGTLFFLAGIFILLTSILGLLLILYKAIIGPNATYEQYEKSLRKLFFFWVMMLIADSVGLFMFIKMRSFLLFIIGLLLILPLISIMWGASAQLKALRRIRNTVVSMRYMDREAEEITMDVVKLAPRCFLWVTLNPEVGPELSANFRDTTIWDKTNANRRMGLNHCESLSKELRIDILRLPTGNSEEP